MRATGSRQRITFIEETAFGVTPTTPETQEIEFVNFTIEETATQLSDPSISSHRQVKYSRRGNSSTGGDIEVVLCPDNVDPFLQAVLQGDWASDVLKVGQKQRSFTFEQGFMDIGQYRTFTGTVFNTLALTVTPDALVNITFGVTGSEATAFTTTPLDATPADIEEKDKFYHEGGVFKEGGVSVGYLASISLNVTNNVEGTLALGTNGFRHVTSGRFNATGSVTALFETPALYNKFKNNVDSSLEFTLVAGAETLTFNMPKIKYGSGSIVQNGEGPLVVEVGFEAIYDAAEGSTMTITRA